MGMHSPRYIGALVAALFAALLLASCGSAGDATSGATTPATPANAAQLKFIMQADALCRSAAEREGGLLGHIYKLELKSLQSRRAQIEVNEADEGLDQMEEQALAE